MVTHDQEEALSIADTVSVMVDGRIVQTSPPKALYFRPVSAFVADFVGEATFIDGTANRRQVKTVFGNLLIDQELSGPVRVMLRPEIVGISLLPGRASQQLKVTVLACQFYGHDQLISFKLPDGTHLLSRVGPEVHLKPGDEVFVHAQGVHRAFPVENK